MKKLCTKCLTMKLVKNFYKHARDTYQSWCKTCCYKYKVEYRLKNKEALKEYKRKWRASNKDRLKQYDSGCTARYQKTYPNRIKANNKLNYAVKTGKLSPPKDCETTGCSNNSGLIAHHNDYSRPLDVQWLCHSCHGLIHSKRKGIGQ